MPINAPVSVEKEEFCVTLPESTFDEMLDIRKSKPVYVRGDKGWVRSTIVEAPLADGRLVVFPTTRHSELTEPASKPDVSAISSYRGIINPGA